MTRLPHALEDLFLDDSQQFGLLVQRNVVDIIQVNRSAVSQFESAGAVLIRTGERAFLVAVQFTFDQGRRQQRAPHFDVGRFAAVGLPVDH